MNKKQRKIVYGGIELQDSRIQIHVPDEIPDYGILGRGRNVSPSKIEMLRHVLKALIIQSSPIEYLEDEKVCFLLLTEDTPVTFKNAGVCVWSKILYHLSDSYGYGYGMISCNTFLVAYRLSGDERTSTYRLLPSKKVIGIKNHENDTVGFRHYTLKRTRF